MLFTEDTGQLSFTGLIFSPDGSRIYLSNVAGSVKVFGVDALHHVQALYSIPLPPANAPRRKVEIPAGLALSADGNRLYVALNLSNRAAEFDSTTGEVLRSWDAGVAPYDVVVAGDKIYVSNWGGRRPDAGSVTGPAGRGTVVRVDARGVASEGSVTVIDAKANRILPGNPHRQARVRPGALPQRTLAGGGQRGQRHAQRHRHAVGRSGGDDLRAAKSGGLVRRQPQCAGL